MERFLSRYRTLRHTLAQLSPSQAFVLLVAGSVFLLLLWSALARVDIIVRTDGRIIPAGKSQIVQHLEGGIIRKILVQEGQVVSAGQPMIELSDIQARSSLGQDQSRMAALKGREARLLAEVNGAASIAFPADLKDASVINVETVAWKARRAQLAEETRMLRAQALQKSNEFSEMVSKRQNLNKELEVAQKHYRLIDGLRRNNAASELEVLDSQSRIQRLNSQIAEAATAIPRIQAARAEADSRANEVVARFRAEASSALTQVREDMQKAGHGIDATSDRLDRNIVRAPVSGFINKLNVATLGGVVRPSEALLEITPNDQRIVIETRANPNDRSNLRRGLTAHVRIGAYSYTAFGVLTGKVSDVSADSISDEKGGRYYRVNIEVSAEEAAKSLKSGHGALVPGMAASVDIVVGKRAILSYLISPLARFRDGVFRAGAN